MDNEHSKQPPLVREAADRAKARVNKVHPAPPWHERVFTAVALKSKVFTPISYVIHGLMPDGLSMLVGRPKIGKSWLMGARPTLPRHP